MRIIMNLGFWKGQKFKLFIESVFLSKFAPVETCLCPSENVQPVPETSARSCWPLAKKSQNGKENIPPGSTMETKTKPCETRTHQASYAINEYKLHQS